MASTRSVHLDAPQENLPEDTVENRGCQEIRVLYPEAFRTIHETHTALSRLEFGMFSPQDCRIVPHTQDSRAPTLCSVSSLVCLKQSRRTFSLKNVKRSKYSQRKRTSNRQKFSTMYRLHLTPAVLNAPGRLESLRVLGHESNPTVYRGSFIR